MSAKQVAATITALWVLGVSVVIYHSESALTALKLNELGDFLAGVFAPVAFVWLVAAVWIQSAELKEQRTELQLTREEFGHQREVMLAQADEARKQAEFIGTQTKLLEFEEIRRVREEADATYDELHKGLIRDLREHPAALSLYHLDERKFDFIVTNDDCNRGLENFGGILRANYREFYVELEADSRYDFIFSNPPVFKVVKTTVRSICNTLDFLSPAKRLHATRVGYALFMTIVDEIEMLTRHAPGEWSPPARRAADEETGSGTDEGH